MRSVRGVLLLAIAAILATVGAIWYRARQAQVRHRPPPAQSLPLGTDAAAKDWLWEKFEGSRKKVEVRSKGFRGLAEPARLELEGVELKIFDKSGKTYDQVRSAKAEFDREHGRLYSEGEAEIVMGLPAEAGAHAGRLVKIVSSGVSFESETGKAYTERAARFSFDQGEGSSVGADYDPQTRELVMKNEVRLDWRGRTPQSKPMRIEAGELIYKENDSVVLLNRWARLTRAGTSLDAGNAYVNLRDGAIERVEAQNARGSERQPARQLDYEAPHLFMHLSPEGEVQKIEGFEGTRLVSTSDSGTTTVKSERVTLDFEETSGESALKQVLAMGKASVESAPAERPGASRPETRVLTSDVLLLAMRNQGKEIDYVEARAPGRLEFLPNAPGQRHRTLDAANMLIHYGDKNRIRSFRASDAATRTESERRDPKKPPPPPSLTWSKDLLAEFDPQTGKLARIEQWNDFRYEQGERKAQAHRAVMHEDRDQVALDGTARVWDSAGSIFADRILMDQKSGDTQAHGNVISSRLPDRKGKSSAVLSNEQPLEARAPHMETFGERNQTIRYSGGAVTWQGPNRIQGDTIEIDRAGRKLSARGNVRTQLVDEQKSPDAKQQRPPGFVVVEAAALVYTEADRLAHYTGGARMLRSGLEVKGAEIRAYLNEPDKDNSLDRAIADGKVSIVRQQGSRNLTVTGEHAEYYAADQKIVVNGGDPTLVDSTLGVTRGRELTYLVKEDRLAVSGAEKKPVVSRIKRK